MKERPILFQGDMVRAILEDRKTQTRRIIKPQPISNVVPVCMDNEEPIYWAWDGEHILARFLSSDLLWVKESHYYRKFVPYATSADVVYRADYPGEPRPPMGIGRPWRPSIHMHRWASRLDLEITGIRAERLQAISDTDAQAEGVDPYEGARGTDDIAVGFNVHEYGYSWARARYAILWESINGIGSWDENPWVWVLTF